MTPKILIAASPETVQILRPVLRLQNYHTIFEPHFLSMLSRIHADRPDLIVLGSGIKGEDANKACWRIRQSAAIADLPVLILGSNDDTNTRLEAFDAGADEFVTPDQPIQELTARIKALLRRFQFLRRPEILEFGDLTIDVDRHRVLRKSVPLALSPTAFRLLYCLMLNARRTLSRSEIASHVWGPRIHVEARTIDVHIRRMRAQLRDANGFDPIRTVRGHGYALDLQG
ncbi:MAG: winged helix-turn-helix domain-containing protein [Rhodospirillaceae bacterium]|nr:winged helix-turn-helix domain-containing protein [Rhodospirillales bacterium]